MIYLIIYFVVIPIHGGLVYNNKHPKPLIELLNCLLTGMLWPLLWLMGIGIAIKSLVSPL